VDWREEENYIMPTKESKKEKRALIIALTSRTKTSYVAIV
jgi:hypothetical protein